MYSQINHWVLVLLCCISIGLSSWLIVLLIKVPKLRKRHSNKIFFSYLIAGLLASTFRAAYHASTAGLERVNLEEMVHTVDNFVRYKALFTVIDNTNVLLTLMHLLLLSVERFTAIKFSYFYERHATNSLALTLIAGIWASALLHLMVTLLIFFLENGRICFAVLVATMMIWIISGICFLPASNITIFYISWKQIKSIQKLQVGTKPSHAKEIKQELHAALVCSLIVLNFLIVWCPVLVTVIQVYWFQCWCHTLNEVCSFLVVFGSITDALIYMVFNVEIRKAFLKMSRCKKANSSENKGTTRHVSITQEHTI